MFDNTKQRSFGRTFNLNLAAHWLQPSKSRSFEKLHQCWLFWLAKPACECFIYSYCCWGLRYRHHIISYQQSTTSAPAPRTAGISCLDNCIWSGALNGGQQFEQSIYARVDSTTPGSGASSEFHNICQVFHLSCYWFFSERFLLRLSRLDNVFLVTDFFLFRFENSYISYHSIETQRPTYNRAEDFFLELIPVLKISSFQLLYWKNNTFRHCFI